MTCNELSNLIIQNRDSIAFLVGNGIHNYETYNKGIQGKVCWKELIDNIRKQLAPQNTHGFIKRGGKLPKKFDAIVQEYSWVGDVGGLVHLEVGAGYALEPFACECFDFFDVAIVLGVERIVVEFEAIVFSRNVPFFCRPRVTSYMCR